jgi:hypothetical protein
VKILWPSRKLSVSAPDEATATGVGFPPTLLHRYLPGLS